MKKTSFLTLLCVLFNGIVACNDPKLAQNETAQSRGTDTLGQVAASPNPTSEYGFQTQYTYTFEGKKDNEPIHLSIYIFEDGQVKGHYHYERELVQMPIVGKSKGNDISFTTFGKNQQNEVFEGKMDRTDVITGKWTDAATKTERSFSLRLLTCGARRHFEDFMYSRETYGTAETVETFMKAVKTAMLKEDSKWLSENTQFPINVTMDAKKVAVQNAAEFVEHYADIFHPKYKEQIETACPVDLFTRNGQVMLGNGAVWIENRASETNNKYIIIAINN
jgi:hypothetical protein